MSGTNANPLNSIEMVFEFGSFTGPTGTSFFGAEAVDLIMVEDTAPIPEPTTIVLLGIGLAGLAGSEVRRRRGNKTIN